MSRMLPWVSLTVPIAACQAAPSSSSKGPLAELPSVTMASVDGATPIESEVLPPTAVVESPSPLEPPTAAELTSDVRNANAFTFRILARTKKPAENAMISGTSMRHALGTTYIGARGVTAREMATALALDTDEKKAASLARVELAAWQDARGNAELNVASRLWIASDFTLRPDFVKTAEAAFGASPTNIEYARPDEARRTINTWVAGKTKDKIPELLPQGSVDPQTRLVVTNAISFKGRWELPFPKGTTKDEPFKTDRTGGAHGEKSEKVEKSEKNVPMMHVTDSFRFAAPPGSGVKVLEMRYAESQLAMLVVLPDDPQGLAKLESSLGVDSFEKWTNALASARVNVTLPRFTFRSGGAMSGPLEDLGMKVAFTDKADFSGIVEPRERRAERLMISDVFHQTWVAVDELGTEAAAATGTVMRTTSMDVGPIVDFRADHPFLFLIHDAKHGRILFAGRVADPKA